MPSVSAAAFVSLGFQPLSESYGSHVFIAGVTMVNVQKFRRVLPVIRADKAAGVNKRLHGVLLSLVLGSCLPYFIRLAQAVLFPVKATPQKPIGVSLVSRD